LPRDKTCEASWLCRRSRSCLSGGHSKCLSASLHFNLSGGKPDWLD
jgi:hypothetical protein